MITVSVMSSLGLFLWLRLLRPMQSATFVSSLKGSGHHIVSVIFKDSGEQMAFLGECHRVHFSFVFSLSEWVYGLLVAFGGCTGSPSFLSECVSWFLGRLCWLHWVSFCLSECVFLLLVVVGFRL